MVTSKGLLDSEEDQCESQRFKFLYHNIGVTDTKAITCRKSEQTLHRHDTRRSADCWPPRGGGRGAPLTHASKTPP
jgi:hypothetical protein